MSSRSRRRAVSVCTRPPYLLYALYATSSIPSAHVHGRRPPKVSDRDVSSDRPRTGIASAVHPPPAPGQVRPRVHQLATAAGHAGWFLLLSCCLVNRWRPGFPSDFPPPDARPRGMGRNRRGRQVTAEAAGMLIVHVASDDRDYVGMRRDEWGDGGATCKIAGIAYTGSNPVPATSVV